MAGKSSKAGQRLLVLKHNKWWFRRAVPAALQALVGRGAFYMVNLNTGDLKLAQRLRNELERDTSELFDTLREGARPLTPREQGLMHRELIRELLQNDGAEAGEASPLEHAQTSLESTVDAFKDARQRDEFLAAAYSHEDATANLDAHLANLRRNGIVEKSVKEREGLIRLFAKWASEQRPSLMLTKIDRKVAGKYVAERLDALHPKTQSKHLMALRGYWIYLTTRGLIDPPSYELRNSGWPWNAQQLRNKATRAERGSRSDRERPYTDSEVSALLYAPYPDGISQRYEVQLRDATRISLLSGMRMSEVLRLWVSDVKTSTDGVGLIFDIQEGKTDAAARPVPVHSELMETIQRRLLAPDGSPKAPDQWLFHELMEERDPSDTFGKRFRRFRLALAVDDRREGKRRSLVNFHSARRWFATSAERAGQTEAIIKDVIGHEPDEKNVTRRYIALSTEAQMRRCIEAVRLPPIRIREAI